MLELLNFALVFAYMFRYFLVLLLSKMLYDLNLTVLLHDEIVSFLKLRGMFNKVGNSWLVEERDLVILPGVGIGRPASPVLAKSSND